MSDIAAHMRIASLQPTDVEVNSRKAAMVALKNAWNKEASVEAIIDRAAQIAEVLSGDGMPNAKLGAQVEALLRKRGASAYVYTERPLDVGIVAGLAAQEILSVAPNTSGWQISDVWAVALWSALSFQPRLAEDRRERLRVEVLEAARTRSEAGSEAARQRVPVPDFGKLTLPAGQPLPPEIFQEATTATIEALRRNAALDREELDFLWSALIPRSRLLDRPFSKIDEPLRIVASGLEAAALLRRFPTQVHRDLVLRTLDANPSLDLPELLSTFGEHRAKLAGACSDAIISRAPQVFPLLHALSTGSPEAEGAKIKRSVAEWGGRTLLEAGLMKMRTGPAKL